MNDKGKNRIHEGQATGDPVFAHQAVEETRYVDDPLLPMQRIEGGGGPKRVHFDSMPAPVRYLGYFFVFIVPVLFVILIIISFIK